MAIATPCNNKGAHSVDLKWWMLIGKFCTDLACKHPWQVMACKHPWQVMPDLCFYRNPEEIEKKEQAPDKKAVTEEEFQGNGLCHLPRLLLLNPRT